MFSFSDLLFPKISLTGVTGKWLTDDELKKLSIRPVYESKIQLRQRSLKYIDEIKAVMPYNNFYIKKIIRKWKYNRMNVYGEILSKLLLEANFQIQEGSILCSVPLHWSRKFWRGFNQSEILASAISSKRNIQVVNLLKRNRATGFQSHRNRQERLLALNGAFKYIGENSPPANIILIDDLATTGATLNECAKALKFAGVRRVEGWVVAHG